MIIFKETSPDTNVIHIITGPETDFQLDMSGHIVVPLDDKIEADKKNFLFFNKCMATEEELRHQFNYFSHQITQEMAKHEEVKHTVQKKEAKPKTTHSSPPSPTSLNETFMSNLKCPKCLSWGTFIKDGVVTMCNSCKSIEKGIEKVTPLSKKEKKILDDLFKDDNNKESV